MSSEGSECWWSHLPCCYGNTSGGAPGKAAEMWVVEWHGKSGLWKEWLFPSWRNLQSCFCSDAPQTSCLEIKRGLEMESTLVKNTLYGHAVLLCSRLHAVTCGCASPSPSVLLQYLPHSRSRRRKSMLPALLYDSLQFRELQSVLGPEVQNGVCSATLHGFHPAVTEAV